MNKPPYYHNLGLLFTLTVEECPDLIEKIEATIKKHKKYVPGSFDIDSHSAEAGDPTDL
jgi:hypothetical protein